jgi:hypothetical protein
MNGEEMTHCVDFDREYLDVDDWRLVISGRISVVPTKAKLESYIKHTIKYVNAPRYLVKKNRAPGPPLAILEDRRYSTQSDLLNDGDSDAEEENSDEDKDLVSPELKEPSSKYEQCSKDVIALEFNDLVLLKLRLRCYLKIPMMVCRYTFLRRAVTEFVLFPCIKKGNGNFYWPIYNMKKAGEHY